MDNSGIRLKLTLFGLVNLFMVTGCFVASWLLYYNNRMSWSYQAKGNSVMSLLFFVLYFLIIKVYDAFSLGTQRKMELVISQSLSAVFSDGLMYIVVCLLLKRFAPVWPFIIVVIAQILIILIWVIVTKKWYYASTSPRRTVLLHNSSKEAGHLQKEMYYDKRLEVVATMDILDCLDENFAPLEGAELVFICADPGSEREAVIEFCTARKLSFFIVPAVNDLLIVSANHVHMFHTPLIQMHMSEPSLIYLFAKRVMDIVLSVCALLMLWPVFIVVALIIKTYDHGPVFYKQIRLTKDGREFELVKFRSMRVDAEADGVARLSTGDNDDRITPVGKWIRKCRLDELPQLLCILKGDMSIVGPRPERPELAAKIEEKLPEFSQRLQVKAGLTGYAQVYGKYNSTPREKLQMDMIYISRASLVEDLRLIFTTVRVLFIKESTEGFETHVLEGETTS